MGDLPAGGMQGIHETGRQGMERENRTKTFFMVAGLAGFLGVGVACMGLFGGDSKPAPKPAAATNCDGLEGQAKADCQKTPTR